MEEISKKTDPGRIAIVIMDQAGWHTSNKLKKFENVIPIMLPPYSPELNPVEQVWKQLREDSLANRCFENYEDIIQSCAKAWNKFTGVVDNVRSLCSREWANLANNL